MPLVHIDLLRGRADDELNAITACVHEALTAELGVPERDDFQVVTEHEPGRLIFHRNYLDIERSDGWILVQITLASGRTTDAKQSFYQSLCDRLIERIGLRSEDLTVVLSENGREDWSFGNGRASYLVLPPGSWK